MHLDSILAADELMTDSQDFCAKAVQVRSDKRLTVIVFFMNKVFGWKINLLRLFTAEKGEIGALQQYFSCAPFAYVKV
jgi:hypothetical protein